MLQRGEDVNAKKTTSTTSHSTAAVSRATAATRPASTYRRRRSEDTVPGFAAGSKTVFRGGTHGLNTREGGSRRLDETASQQPSKPYARQP